MDSSLNRRQRELIGALLQLERKHKSISQEEIAQILDVRQDQISKIECGKRRIDIVELMGYCDELELRPTQFAAKIERYLHGLGVINKRPNMKYQRGLLPMKKIRVDISWLENHYSATFVENVPDAVPFTAESFLELQEKAKKSIASYIKRKDHDGEEVQEWIRDGQYEFKYKFMDARSLLNAYKQFLSLAAISRVSGINQNLLSLYASGKKKSSSHQVERIADAINKIGEELMAVVP